MMEENIIIKGDRLLFLYVKKGTGLMGSGLAIDNRNFSAFDYLGFSMITPNPKAVLFLQEKVACPLFREIGKNA